MLLNDALKYAEGGWHVHPLVPGAKEPMTPHGFKDATTDRRQVVRWWSRTPNANIGISTGPSGLLVVDVDTGPGKVGAETWAALVAEHGCPGTRTVRTRNGGLQLYFRTAEPLRSGSGHLGTHVDTRGEGGYVVAPPSVVEADAGAPGDGAYTVVDDRAPAPVPEWIRERLGAARTAARGTLEPYSCPPSSAAEVRIRELSEELAQAPDGSGNQTCARLAFMAGQYVGAGQVEEEVAVRILLDGISGWTWTAPGDEARMVRTVQAQVRAGASVPRPWATPAARPLELEDDGGAGADGPKAPSDHSSDAGQARWILESNPGLLHVAGVGFLLWNGLRWVPSSREAVGALVLAHYRREHERAAREFVKDPTSEDRARRCKFLASRQNSSKVDAVIRALVWLTTLPGDNPVDRLDAHPYLLNTPDGVVDLRTGEVRPHDPGLLLTKITSGSYRPGAVHEDWTAASRCQDGEVWAYLQLRMGAALISDSRPDTMIFLQGVGANGKSTLGTDGVLPALGGYAHLTSPGVLVSGGRQGDGALSPDTAALLGTRLVTFEELPDGAVVDADAMKRLVGTSTVQARTLHERPVTFRSTWTLFGSTNHLPQMTDTTDGAWRRVLLVPFRRRFVMRPSGPDELRSDVGLRGRLISGADGQHDAIVTWLVEGARRYLADPESIMKGREPESIRAATEAWRREVDVIAGYVGACLELDPGSMVMTRDLYLSYCQWAAETGRRPMSARTLLGRLTAHATMRSTVRTQVRALDGLSRPQVGGVLPPPPAAPEVIRGVRFAP